MFAFKGFDKNLRARYGKGNFQFEPGETYEEPECKCAHNGFHCSEDPLCALGYYNEMSARFFVVKAEGDINHDASDRIACTRMTLVKEITRIELAGLACKYIEKHPERVISSGWLDVNKGKCQREGDFIIVRGKHPMAAGVKGSYLFLIQEKAKCKEIKAIYPVYVDGEEIQENVYYRLDGDKLCAKTS